MMMSRSFKPSAGTLNLLKKLKKLVLRAGNVLEVRVSGAKGDAKVGRWVIRRASPRSSPPAALPRAPSSAPVSDHRWVSIQPELWVNRAGAAVAFYEAAFGATVLHRVGDGDDIVAQLGVGDAVFWVAAASTEMGRFSPAAIRRGDEPHAARGRRSRRGRPPRGGRRRDRARGPRGRARLAAGPHPRPVRPRVGDRQTARLLAARAPGAVSGSAPTPARVS
jgi:hypothetical protein